MERERYNPSHANPGRIFRPKQAQASSGHDQARPPGVPTLEELRQLNRRIHEFAEVPEHFKLDEPSQLESCLDRAHADYADTPEGIINSAAVLAHGIAHAQAFRDGNKRTAYFATLTFLEGHGYGYLTEIDGNDHMLGRYLNQVVNRQTNKPGPEKFVALFTRRHQDRRSPTGEPRTH